MIFQISCMLERVRRAHFSKILILLHTLYLCKCSRRRTRASCWRCWCPCWCSWSPPHDAPAPPKLGLDMKTSLLASAARSRADRTRRAHPRTHEPNSDFGQRFPHLGAMGLHHTPALAHNALKPQAIARRRAFRKATHRFAPPATRKRTRLPRARSRTTTCDKHYSCTAGVRGFGTVSPSTSWRQPPPRNTSRLRAPGHPPARAGPCRSRPLGRSPFSAGE